MEENSANTFQVANRRIFVGKCEKSWKSQSTIDI